MNPYTTHAPPPRSNTMQCTVSVSWIDNCRVPHRRAPVLLEFENGKELLHRLSRLCDSNKWGCVFAFAEDIGAVMRQPLYRRHSIFRLSDFALAVDVYCQQYIAYKRALLMIPQDTPVRVAFELELFEMQI